MENKNKKVEKAESRHKKSRVAIQALEMAVVVSIASSW
jgi:hypothetical protein